MFQELFFKSSTDFVRDAVIEKMVGDFRGQQLACRFGAKRRRSFSKRRVSLPVEIWDLDELVLRLLMRYGALPEKASFC